MLVKVKAFIYRLSVVFGLRIYLAKKEEEQYIQTLGQVSPMIQDCHRGLWQAKHGFLSVWTYQDSFLVATYKNIKNVFRI